jgi:spore coat polysaccharide biosynthesis protein SpsF
LKNTSKNKVIGLIQARMNSTRLPGKVLFEISGKPILWHMYQRLKQSKLLDDVVISTGPKIKNKKIYDFASKENINCYFGSEGDLIERLFQTAQYYDASAIVRVTGDCPFVDPVIVDTMLSQYIKTKDKYDIVMNSKTHTFPHGLEIEIYPFETIKKLHFTIKDTRLREWFPVYIDKNQNDFKILNVTSEKDYPKFRLTVDYIEDYEFTKSVYQELYKDGHIFLLDEIVDLLSKRADLVKINSEHIDKINIDAPK